MEEKRHSTPTSKPKCKVWWTERHGLGRKNEFLSLSRHFAGEYLSNFYSTLIRLSLNRSWMMQQDNDPKHRSKSTTDWLQQKKIRLLEWPSQSPDLNSIEMLWHDLKRAVHTRHPKNITELKQFCKEECSKIPHDRCAGLIRNYRNNLVEVIAAKGGSTSY